MTALRDRIPRFLREVRRRHVIRVTVGYGAAAFVIGQVADIVLPALGLDSLVRITVITLLAGLPLVVVLAWVYDITSEGVQRTPDLEARTDGILPAAAPFAAPAPEGTIAALPFENLGAEEHRYFTEGLTEELIDALARVPGLRVAARTSSFAVRRESLDVRAIGARLGVRHVVEGSVRVLGASLLMSVRLVDVANGYTVWSEKYERGLDDVFAVQREVSEAIARRLASHGETARIATLRVTTTSLDALEQYLQGKYCCNRRTEGDLIRSIRFFEAAIERDPGYALAHAGLAESYAILMDYGAMPVPEALERARSALDRALALDPAAAETWTSLALVRGFEWRWGDAEAAFRRSIELRPEYPVAHQRFALQLSWLGRCDEALREARTAQALDPLSLPASATVGWVLYYARRYGEAIEQLRDTLARDAHFATARIALGRALLAAGTVEAALAEHERALADSAGTSSTLSLLAHARGRAGDAAGARKAAAELEGQARQEYVSSYYLALPHLGLGEHDRALDLLEAALEERAAQLVYLGADPTLDPLRSSPRFARLLEAVGLPVSASAVRS